MAQRTTAIKVRNVLGRDYQSRAPLPDLQAYINAASRLVDQAIECAAKNGVALTSDDAENAPVDSDQTQMETWLAAHFYKYAWDKQATQKSSAGASSSYTGQTAMYLDGTTYGQTAQMIDPSGCLAAFSKGARVSARWLGRPVSSQTLYANRR